MPSAFHRARAFAQATRLSLHLATRRMRSPNKLLSFGFVLTALVLCTDAAQAIPLPVTAKVTLNTYAAFASQNATPGQIMFLWTSTPNAGNNYAAVANNGNARLNISGNVTNASVNLGTTPGYFTTVFNNGNFSQAVSCTTSPIDFFTSTGYQAAGSTFDVTINCTVPDTTPPVQLSAATDGSGTMLTITFDEDVSESWADQTEFVVSANGVPVTVESVSYFGSTAILTLASPVNAGQTILVSYTGESNGDLYDASWNSMSNFSMTVTNNSTVNGVAAPSVSAVAPSSGPSTGGTSVVITGSGLTGATSVRFGATPASSFTVNSATQVTATAPAHSAGTTDITVTTPGGTSATGAADRFTYSTAPTATSNAASGISASGATLNGTVNDNGATTAVSFDYGTSTSYGTTVAASTGGSVAAGTGATAAAKTIAGLTCNTGYHFRVNGVNVNGTSNGADASFLTSPCVPDAPVIGTATPGDAQASISFSAPASNGGSAITGYSVVATPGGASVSGPSSPLVVTGLTNGTSYSFTVSASNVAGTGSASSASASVTPKANQSITFSNPGAQNFATTPTLTATATSSLTPSFSSSTTGVCTISSGGALAFIAPGTCTVNADQAGSASFNAAPQVSRSFTVNKANQTLSFSQPGAVSYGSAPLDLSGYVTAGGSSSPTSFSIVPGGTGGGSLGGSNNTTLGVSAAGTIILQADQAGDANYNAAPPQQRTLTVNKAALLITAAPQSKNYGAADPALTYTYSTLAGGDTAEVLTGTLSRAPGETVAGSPYAIGQGSVTAGGNYTVSYTGANLTIVKATPVLSWLAPYPVPAGTVLDSRQLNATASLPGSFLYTPAAGTALAAGLGQSLGVSFTPDDTANYNTASLSVTIDAALAAQSISFPPPCGEAADRRSLQPRCQRHQHTRGEFHQLEPGGRHGLRLDGDHSRRRHHHHHRLAGG